MSTRFDQLADDTPDSLAVSSSLTSQQATGEQRKPRSYVRFRALGWLTTAAALAYLCRNATGVPESAIRNELGLTLEQSGWFMSAFFWAYAIFQVPSGWLAERVGTRIALGLFVFAWSIAMLGMGLAQGFVLLVVAQLAMGIAQAGLMPAAVNSIGHWMPLSQRSLACGVLGAGLQVGAVAASGLAAVLIEPLGWRLVFVAFAMPGILWTFGFLARFRDDPAAILPADSEELGWIRAGRNLEELTEEAEPSRAMSLTAIARSPTMWWLCGQQICRSAGYQFFPTWFPTFLQQTHNVSVETSGYLQGVVLAGVLFGCVCGGIVTDWVWRQTGSLRASRGGVGATSLAICAAAFICAWCVESTVVAVCLLAIGNFCAAFAGPSAFAATIDAGGPRVPQVAGLMNMMGNFAAAACPVLVGRLFQSRQDWNLILLLFAGIFLAGAACWLFVNPQRPIEFRKHVRG